jgi:undecaprenyl-diphosphatase
MDHRLAATLIGTASLLPPSAARAADPTKGTDQHFVIDPVADIVLTGAGAGTAALTELILSTGEIVPQPPTTADHLLPFDRVAVTQTIDPNASTYSDIGLGVALSAAVIDPILSGLRDGWDAALVDAAMYAESLSLTLAFTDVTKVSVRRPRPLDYRNPMSRDTNIALSFFSGHASLSAAATATATYLAFIRSPSSPRPWITLASGTLITAFVSYERVRSGAHFPTDVVAGSLVGGAIGVLVPRLHLRREESPNLWIGLAPENGGGSVEVHGLF